MKTTIGVDCLDFERFYQFCAASARNNPEYESALPFTAKAYFAAKRQGLRYDRKRHILRDNDGVIARPSNPSDWPEEAGRAETEEALCRQVWAGAVRMRNLAREEVTA